MPAVIPFSFAPVETLRIVSISREGKSYSNCGPLPETETISPANCLNPGHFPAFALLHKSAFAKIAPAIPLSPARPEENFIWSMNFGRALSLALEHLLLFRHCKSPGFRPGPQSNFPRRGGGEQAAKSSTRL